MNKLLLTLISVLICNLSYAHHGPVITGSWEVAFSHKAELTGLSRGLYVAVGYDNASTGLKVLFFGGQKLTHIKTSRSFSNSTWIETWICNESCIRNAENNYFSTVWKDDAPANVSYSHIGLANLNQKDMINDIQTASSNSANTLTLHQLHQNRHSLTIASCEHADAGTISWEDKNWMRSISQGSNGHSHRSASLKSSPKNEGYYTFSVSHPNTDDFACVAINFN